MKKCAHCKLMKSLDNYHKDKHQEDGYRNRCKECIKLMHSKEKAQERWTNRTEEQRAFAKTWYKRNPDKYKNKATIYRKKHEERIRIEQQERYLKNPLYYKKKNIEWHRNNPGKSAAIRAKRDAAKLQRTPKWLTKEHLKEIEEFYVIAKELQWLSDPTDPLQVDHIMPLQGKNSSGLHVPWNLQILPRSINIRKSNKEPK